MKKVLVIMLLFLGSGTFAQELTVDLDNFTEAEITNGLTVIFTKSDENNVKITGSNREKVKVSIDNNILTIALDRYRLLNGDDTEVVIFYTEIDKITASQNSDIQFSEELKQEKIELLVEQGSDLNVSLEVDTLYARVATSATMIAVGEANYQEIKVNSEGNFQGENLIGETVEIEVRTNGLANVYVNENLNATADSGGTIFIYGEPEKIEEKTTLGGSIKKLK